jgi:dCMP deaminase
MCKRLIINSGIKQVIIRNTKDEYTVVPVSDWVENDESLDGVRGY